MSETVMSEYIKGFDAGYDYVLIEIERFANNYKGNKFALAELLHHLKMEDIDPKKLQGIAEK